MKTFAAVIGAVLGGGTAFLLLAGERISNHIRARKIRARREGR